MSRKFAYSRLSYCSFNTMYTCTWVTTFHLQPSPYSSHGCDAYYQMGRGVFRVQIVVNHLLPKHKIINCNEISVIEIPKVDCICFILCSQIFHCNGILFYTILSHNLERSAGHHRWIRNNPVLVPGKEQARRIPLRDVKVSKRGPKRAVLSLV